MIDQIKQYIEEVKNFHSTNAAEIEEFRIKFLGKKGILTDLFTQFKSVPNEQKDCRKAPFHPLASLSCPMFH